MLLENETLHARKWNSSLTRDGRKYWLQKAGYFHLDYSLYPWANLPQEVKEKIVQSAIDQYREAREQQTGAEAFLL